MEWHFCIIFDETLQIPCVSTGSLLVRTVPYDNIKVVFSEHIKLIICSYKYAHCNIPSTIIDLLIK